MSRHIFFMFFSFFFRRMLHPFQVENTNLICDEFDWGQGSYHQCADGEGIVSLKPYASFPILLTVSGLYSDRQNLSKSITLPVSLFYLRAENLIRCERYPGKN